MHSGIVVVGTFRASPTDDAFDCDNDDNDDDDDVRDDDRRATALVVDDASTAPDGGGRATPAGGVVDDEDTRLQMRFEEAMRRREERRRTTSSSPPAGEEGSGSSSSSSYAGATEADVRRVRETADNVDDGTVAGAGGGIVGEGEGTARRTEYANYDDGRVSDVVSPLPIAEDDEAAVRGRRRGRRRRPERSGMDDDEGPPRSAYDGAPRRRRRRSNEDGVESSDEYHGDYRSRWSDDPHEDREDDVETDRVDHRGDDDSSSSSSTPSSTRVEWETYRSTSILFPPSSPRDEDDGDRRRGHRRRIRRRPKAVIHFVGGTFFGSYPRRFYGSLLEDISRKCDAVVVATPIPIVLLPGVVVGLTERLERWMSDEGGDDYDYDDYDGEGGGGGGRRRGRDDDGRRDAATTNNNPLDHTSLAARVQKEFNAAYRDVILDEYCADCDDYDGEVEDFMREIPIVGMGHSLGARLQAVSCSNPRISKRCLSMGKHNKLIRSGRDGMIYLGFANWGAKSSIPGVESLDSAVRKRREAGRRRRREQRKDRVGDGGVGRRDDVWDDGTGRRGRRRDGQDDDDDDDGARGRYGRYDRGYDVSEDLDLADVFGDVVTGVADGVRRIGEALTPEVEDLEFSPPPDELWDDLSSSVGWYRRSCRNNLIVQFEDDPIDQGSRLARTLLAAYDAEGDDVEKENSTISNIASSGDDDDDRRRDDAPATTHGVKFARLSGGHLTPVTLRGDIASMIPRRAISLLSSTMGTSSNQNQRRDVEDVADTVASYIRSLNAR